MLKVEAMATRAGTAGATTSGAAAGDIRAVIVGHTVTRITDNIDAHKSATVVTGLCDALIGDAV